ncbi:hypothetical protein ACHAXN_012675 [Cyclotella atomus]
MKLHLPLLLSTITLSAAFLSPPPPTHSTTALYQRSLGFETRNLYTREETEQMKVQSKVRHYIRKIRSKIAITPLGKKVLVSGFEPEDPSATMVLDFLNNEEAKLYFPFDSIVAHVPDGKIAKKRMIGRNARYTGLLDKLEFSEGETLIPTMEQLAGVNSWVVHVAGGDMDVLGKVVEAAEGAVDVKNVAILVSGAGGVDQKALAEMEGMVKSKATSFDYTVVVVPEWNDVPEAQCAYGVVNATDVAEVPFAAGETFSREESLRIVTECLAINGAKGKFVVANAFPDKTSVEGMLIQSMRETGFSRIEEVGMMVMNGSKGCMQLIEDMSKPRATPVDTRTPEEKAAEAAKAEQLRKERRAQMLEEQKVQERQEKIETRARKWAEREFYRRSLRSRLEMRQDEFIQMIWDRALLEGELEMRYDDGDIDPPEMEEKRRQWKEQQREKSKATLAANVQRIQEMMKKEIESY